MSSPFNSTDANGIAQTKLTSTNFTRRVQVSGIVYGKDENGNQKTITNFTLVNFVVGNLASIDLVPDRSDIPPDEVANVTVFFNPASEMPDNVRFDANSLPIRDVLESVSTTLNGRAAIRIRNNNPTNTQQPIQLTVRAIRQDGTEMTKSLTLNLLPTQTLAAVELQASPTVIYVSNNDATENPNDRQPLKTPNKTDLTLIVRNLNAGDSVSVTLESTDPRGLFVQPSLAPNSLGTMTFTVTDNGTGDLDNTTPGTIKVSVTYYSSRKAQPVTIRAKVMKRSGWSYGCCKRLASWRRP